jgi:hypothetical protein
MNPNKVDMTLERTPRQWNILLDTIKRNDSNVLTKDEQSYYTEAIEIKLGIRSRKVEVLKMIEESKADEIKID